MNSFAVACGQITVPMSRPSITAPRAPPGGWEANSAEISSTAERTSGKCRDHGGGLARRCGAQLRIVYGLRIDLAGCTNSILGTGWITSRSEHPKCDQPVQRAGIEMSKSIMTREFAGERPFTASRGAVDSDNDRSRRQNRRAEAAH